MSERRVYRYRMVEGVFTEVDNFDPKEVRASALHCVSGDSMEPTWHPCDGEIYDSKSKFREVTRANGCIEVGNEKLKARPREWNETENVRALERAFQKTCQQFNL